MSTEQQAAAPKGRNIIRKATVAKKLGQSISTIDRMRRYDSTFPMAVPIGAQTIGWFEEEIETWLASRPRVQLQ